MDIKTNLVSNDSKSELCTTYNFQNSDTAGLRSVQQLEFKTSLLEAVEELRFRRAAESRYEDQIRNLAVEKQELEWQKESLQHQCNVLSSQHEEAMAVLKKQFQTRINAVEEEKGKFQISMESKEREISGLKEELKGLQVSKYSLEKKLSELEQKVQLQTVAKDNQLSQLSEVEKRFAAISRQCGLVRQAHEKLEQNVDEATRLNKKLITVNKHQENMIHNLKQELEKVTANLIRSKVTSQCKLGEENIHVTEQQQQLEELKEKLQMKTELNKRISRDALTFQEGKKEVLKLLNQTQQLLQRQELALNRTEKELKVYGEKHQILERDNELLRQKAKGNEDRFQILERENEKSTARWKKEEDRLNEENLRIKSELESFKKAHAECQEIQSKLSMQNVQQGQQIYRLQNNLKHFEQHSEQEIAGEQTCVNEALMVNDNKIKQAGMHSMIEEKIKDESSERDDINQEISIHSEDGMINTDNIVTNSNIWSPDTVNSAAKMPEKATDNGAVFVNERQYTIVSTLTINAGEPNDTRQGETGNTCNEAEFASAKINLQCTSVCLAEVPTKGGKKLPDSADALGVCSVDIGQQTDSITHKVDGGRTEAVYDMNDKMKTTQCDKGVFINESPRTEAKAAACSTEIITKEGDANKVRDDTIQSQQSSFDLVSHPVLDETKNEQKSSLQKQHEHSQANILIGENCANDNIVELCQFHKPCSKSDVSPIKLPTDHCIPSIASCKINSSVDVDSKPQSDISVKIGNLGSNNHEEDIIKEISSNAQNNLVSTDDQQKEPHNLETMISDSEANQDIQVMVSNAEALGNQKQLLGNFTQSDDCLIMTSIHSPNFICNTDHSMVLAPISQSTEETNGSANGFESTAESQQTAATKMDLHAEVLESRATSKLTENKLKPSFINASINLVATIALDHKNKTSTSDIKCPSTKAPSQSGWKLCELPFLDSGEEKDMLNKAATSLSVSLLRDKLEDPDVSRRIPSAFTFPKQIGEISLRNSSATDSPSTKRLNDTFNTSSIPLYPKRNSGEWNTTAQTFSDFSQPADQEKLCSSSREGSTIPFSSASMKHQGQFTETSSISCSQSYFHPLSPEVSTSNTMPATPVLLFEEEADPQYAIIKGHISKIERFLSLDRLKHTRKRKAECVIKITPT
ncbi:coiled-coil domain-containing protein 73-like [Chiloscyllium plagiosum]|uniref:coiled-coil domain-containing protein 73-like n=1 Tax=Chiloscyllium plagiosum TaxID=36176 RepID=UPI001CB85A70|nr:coiled-coil domain-containing protein 73-like [Chiloscyllium plagiosum]